MTIGRIEARACALPATSVLLLPGGIGYRNLVFLVYLAMRLVPEMT